MKTLVVCLLSDVLLVTSCGVVNPHDPRVDVLLTMQQQQSQNDTAAAIRALSQRVSRIEQALVAVAESAQTPQPKSSPTPTPGK
jgi:hypothetical protein